MPLVHVCGIIVPLICYDQRCKAPLSQRNLSALRWIYYCIGSLCEYKPECDLWKCTVKHVADNSTCPQPGCGRPANINDQRLEWFQEILDTKFKDYQTTYTPELEPGQAGSGVLYVTVLTGAGTSVPYSGSLTVLDLKRQIKSQLHYDVHKQKLLYDDMELKVRRQDGGLAMLSDYKIPPNATLYLVILLFSVPEGFDHVVFDLFWGYPYDGRDYLDASCLMFSGTEFVDYCDYAGRNALDAVRHSGDVMDDLNCQGHHTIHLHLKRMPESVTNIFFTLSAWDSPNISRYPNPSLRFYEASNPSKDLCKTTFTHARASQAVVMCSMSKEDHGSWQIFESGKLSAGNARNYGPLKATAKSLILQGF